MTERPVHLTLPDMLRAAAGSDAGITYLRSGDRTSRLAYSALLERAAGLLGQFQSRGLKTGDVLVLYVAHNPAFVDAFWACQLGGLIPVPLAAGFRQEQQGKLQQVAALFDRAYLFSDRKHYQAWKNSAFGDPDRFAGRVIELEHIDSLPAGAAIYSPAIHETALIQFSSGSTGEPKGVVLSHANILTNLRAISNAAGIEPRDRTLSWMPLHHDLGLVGSHLLALYNRIDQVNMDTELFVRRPARWLEAIQNYQATLTSSPNFGYQYYLERAYPPLASLSLAGLRLIFNGAEPISVTLARDFTRFMQAYGLRPNAMFPVYGLAEASLAVSFPPAGRALRTRCIDRRSLVTGQAVDEATNKDRHAVELVSVGTPVPDCELRIADASGRVLGESLLGQIQIRGANVTRGYYRKVEGGDDCFSGDGWLDTGDLGFIAAGELYIAGRRKEVMFIRGRNFYPQDIESCLTQASVALNGKIAVCAARSRDNSEDALLIMVQYRKPLQEFVEVSRRLARLLSEQFGLQARHVIPVRQIPKTTSGKFQRYRLVQAFEAGEFNETLLRLQALLDSTDTGTGANSRLEEELLSICRELLPEQVISRDQNLFELGADSLLLVRIHEAIEERFPGRVDVTDLFEYPTPALLAGYIAAQS